MLDIRLHAEKRELLGRRVKKLRRDGLLPANLYGKKIQSQALKLKLDAFTHVYQEAGETGMVKLTVGAQKEERPVLIQNVQFDPITDQPVHADLRQVILSEKVTAQIPVELAGEAPAVEQKIGILIQPVDEVEVEALPLDLPEKLVADIGGLAEVGDSILVKDLKFDKGKVELRVDENLTVAKIEPLAKEEAAPPPAEGGVAEGETPTVAEAPAAVAEESGSAAEQPAPAAKSSGES